MKENASATLKVIQVLSIEDTYFYFLHFKYKTTFCEIKIFFLDKLALFIFSFFPHSKGKER